MCYNMEEVKIHEYTTISDYDDLDHVDGGIALRFGLDAQGCYVMELHYTGAYAAYDELPDDVVKGLRELIRIYDTDTEEERDVLLGHYFGETDQDMIRLCFDGVVLSWQVGDNTELELVNPSDIDKLRDFFTKMSSGDNGDNGDGDVQHTGTDDDHGGVSKSV